MVCIRRIIGAVTDDVNARLYPEIVAAGDLVSWLRAECARAGLPYRPEFMPDVIGRWRGAVADDGERSIDVLLNGCRRRRIDVRLKERGKRMATGYAPDLPTVLPDLHRWQSGSRLREVVADWPFFGSVAMAEARERDDAIEYSWLIIHEDVYPGYGYPEIKDLLDLAFHTPQLRAMMPLLQRHKRMLRLAATPGPPYGRDAPAVLALSGGSFAVHAADGRELGVTDAAGAIALVMAEFNAQDSQGQEA